MSSVWKAITNPTSTPIKPQQIAITLKAAPQVSSESGVALKLLLLTSVLPMSALVLLVIVGSGMHGSSRS
jgi:hypothetical protein